MNKTRKTFVIIYCIILVLTTISIIAGIQGWNKYQEYRFFAADTIISTSRPLVIAIPRVQTDSLLTPEKKAEREELEYYLARHNVRDDGYEMVANYYTRLVSDSVKMRNLPDFHLWNIGRWQGLAHDGPVLARFQARAAAGAPRNQDVHGLEGGAAARQAAGQACLGPILPQRQAERPRRGRARPPGRP